MIRLNERFEVAAILIAAILFIFTVLAVKVDDVNATGCYLRTLIHNVGESKQ